MVKFPDRFLVMEIMNRLIIAVAHLDEIGRELARFRITLFEISFEIAAVTPDRFAQLGQFLERFENVFQLRGGDLFVVGQVLQAARLPRRAR